MRAGVLGLPGFRGIKAIVDFNNCTLQNLLSHAERLRKESNLRIHIIRVIREDNRLHAWVRIAGSKSAMRKLLQKIAKTRESYYTIIGETYGGTIVYITVPSKRCGRSTSCPLASPSPRIIPISTVIQDGKMKALVVASSKKSLDALAKKGFQLEVIVGDHESQQSLTNRQEEILMKAFMIGYYSYPRNADLKDLAKATGLSLSTVAELIRKAEMKLIKRFLLEELLIAYIRRDSDGSRERIEDNSC